MKNEKATNKEIIATVSLNVTFKKDWDAFKSVNKDGTHVDLLLGKKHVLGIKQTKDGSFVIYVPKTVIAFVATEGREFKFHEKWGMPYEMKGASLETVKAVIADMKKGFYEVAKKLAEAEKQSKTEKQSKGRKTTKQTA